MQKTIQWGSFGLGSIGFVIGFLLTQAPGKDHSLDFLFLVVSAASLGLACWLLIRDRDSTLRNVALTLAVLEVLAAAYGVISIVTYSH
jgi:hypothetical protein